MPAPKRPASRSAAESAPDPKRVEVDENEQDDEAENNDNAGSGSEDEDGPDPEKEFEPNEYVCLFVPPYGKKSSDDDEDDEEDEDEDDEDEDDIHRKPASDHPDHKFVIMWEGFKRYHDLCRWATYCDPDSFDMYIYNDYVKYGVIQLIENTLHDFDKALKAKDTKLAWNMIASLGHFLNHSLADLWMNADDADRVNSLNGLLGSGILTALNEIDKAGWLSKDSEIKDLGLVMALYIRNADMAAEVGDLDSSCREPIVQYSKKADIDLKDAGIKGVGESVELYKDAEAMDGETGNERWEWSEKYKTYNDKFRPPGEPKGKFTKNILLFSRAERAQYAFDKKDPLAQFSVKDLKEGNIMLK